MHSEVVVLVRVLELMQHTIVPRAMTILVAEVGVCLFGVLRVKESLHEAIGGAFNVHHLKLFGFEHTNSHFKIFGWFS